jgi:hypothetical protein
MRLCEERKEKREETREKRGESVGEVECDAKRFEQSYIHNSDGGL